MEKIDEKMLECVRALKWYCSSFGGDCTDCLFYRNEALCVLATIPEKWNVEDLSKTKAVELLKEMRYNALNATQYDDKKREAKAEALTMAIEALGGSDDGRD